MKKLALIVALCFVIVSGCKKDNDTPAKTEYKIVNKCSFALVDVSSYYYNGTDIVDQKQHGDMLVNDMTATYETARPHINAGFSFVQGGSLYIIGYPFVIKKNRLNTFSFTDTMHVFGKKGNKIDYTKSYKLIDIAR